MLSVSSWFNLVEKSTRVSRVASVASLYTEVFMLSTHAGDVGGVCVFISLNRHPSENTGEGTTLS